MAEPFAVYDKYTDTKTLTILTEAQHGIPGLRMIGRNLAHQAAAPLRDHIHPDCFEFSYLEQGNLLYSVHGENYSLSGGDLFITFPDEVHSTGSNPMSLHKQYWFQLEASRPEHFLFLQPDAAAWLLKQLRGLSARVLKMDSSTAELFRTVFEDLSGGTQEGKYQAAALIHALLCQILRNANGSDWQISSDIALVRDYILSHLEQSLPLEELAQMAVLSVSRFKQKFKDQMGTAPRNYINFHKIELAKQMLAKGLSATETAMDLGFSGSDYFSVVFRRYTSQTPSEFKAAHKDNISNEKSKYGRHSD